MKKNLTIKRDKKKELAQRKLLEQERAETAALVEKHSKEMMLLITEKRANYLGGFQLLDLIIIELKSHVTCYKFKVSHWWKKILYKICSPV